MVGKTLSCARKFHTSLYSAKILVEKVPALGESITEGSVASWGKKEGDAVAVDDVIVIVETDKVTVDIKSTHAGVFKKKLVTDNVRQLFAYISSLKALSYGVVHALN